MKNGEVVTLNVDGGAVSYRVYKINEGEEAGRPIVFLHGTTDDGKKSYRRILRYLRGNRQVVLPDYAGCGASDFPKCGTIEKVAEQVIAVIDDLGFGEVDLVGHSMGAITAAVVASKKGKEINKLVLSAPWSNAEDPRLKLILKTWLDLLEYRPEASIAYGLTHFFRPEYLSSLGEDTIKKVINGGIESEMQERVVVDMESDITEYLKKIVSTTLIIALKNDYLIPNYLVKKVHELVNNSEYKEIEGGHAVQIENGENWCKLINEFTL